jgi:hypothetical protein
VYFHFGACTLRVTRSETRRDRALLWIVELVVDPVPLAMGPVDNFLLNVELPQVQSRHPPRNGKKMRFSLRTTFVVKPIRFLVLGPHLRPSPVMSSL